MVVYIHSYHVIKDVKVITMYSCNLDTRRCVDSTSMIPSSRRRTTISRHPSNLDLGGTESVTEEVVEEEEEETGEGT